MAHGPELSIDIARMDFGGTPLFEGLRLEVAAGSAVGLVGPSGIGKSSLLRMIAGTERGYRGQILIGGCLADRAPAPGIMFQDARLLPWLDLGQNLRAARPHLGEAELGALLDEVRLSGLQGAWPRELSGGMQRRASLARALAARAGLWLLDEPFVSLDAETAQDMRQVLARAMDRDRPTVILISHDPRDAALLCDRVLVLEGRPARVAADLDLGRPGPEMRPETLAARLARIG